MAKKILVVDDEPQVVDTIRARLEANGYEVVTGYDGMEALNMARKKNPDLVILDLMLPKLDGYQVCRMLKFDKKMSKIPIIMLTGLGEKEDREWGQKVKADAYITKPFNVEELLKKIGALLSR